VTNYSAHHTDLIMKMDAITRMAVSVAQIRPAIRLPPIKRIDTNGSYQLFMYVVMVFGTAEWTVPTFNGGIYAHAYFV
jgi:hypothetical protein